MKNILNQLRDEQFITIKIQAIVFGVDLSLLVSDNANSYVYFSLLAVFSLFILQVLNHRMLLLTPFNNFVKRSSRWIDTHLLYTLLLVSVLSMCIGIFMKILDFSILDTYSHGFPTFHKGECWIQTNFIYVTFFLIIVVPTLLFIFRKKMNDCIAKSLSKTPWCGIGEYTLCPKCNASMREVHEIVSRVRGRVTPYCPTCGISPRPLAFRLNVGGYSLLKRPLDRLREQILWPERD